MLSRVSPVKAALLAGIDKNPAGGPTAPNEAHRYATGGAPGDTRWRGDAPGRLAMGGAGLQDHLTAGVERDGPAGMPKAAVSDFHEAVRENVLEESTGKLDDVEGGSAWA